MPINKQGQTGKKIKIKIKTQETQTKYFKYGLKLKV